MASHSSWPDENNFSPKFGRRARRLRESLSAPAAPVAVTPNVSKNNVMKRMMIILQLDLGRAAARRANVPTSRRDLRAPPPWERSGGRSERDSRSCAVRDDNISLSLAGRPSGQQTKS